MVEMIEPIEMFYEMILSYQRGIGDTVSEIRVQMVQQKPVYTKMVNRKSVAWEIRNMKGKYDDRMADDFNEDDLNKKANWMYLFVRHYLVGKYLYREIDFQRVDNRTIFTHHSEKVSWCIAQLSRVGDFSLSKFIDREKVVDESGIYIGSKTLPSRKREEIELIQEEVFGK